MSDKVTIHLSSEYAKHLEALKQVILSKTWEEITDDSKMVEVLIDNFMVFIQEQATHHTHDHEWGCCGGGWHEHKHEHKHWHEHEEEKGSCCKDEHWHKH